MCPFLFPYSSSPRAFHIIWVAGVGLPEYHSSTVSCPVRPHPLTQHFVTFHRYLFYRSLSTLFSVLLSVSLLVLVYLTFFFVPSPCPYLVVERGSSVGRMPDSQSREPGFESPLLPFRSLGIFFHFTKPQSTQLYK